MQEGTVRRIEYGSRSDVFRLYVLADRHLGNCHSKEAEQIAIAKRIAEDENGLWIDLGDALDAIDKTDKRHRASEQAKWAQGIDDVGMVESDRWIEINREIFPKLVGLVRGNHEDTLWQQRHHNVYETMRRAVEGYKVPDNSVALGHRGIVQLRYKRLGGSTWTLPIWATHGSGSSRTPGAVANKLRQYIAQADGVDLVLCGHYHKFATDETIRYRPGRRGIEKTIIRAYSCPPLCADMEYAEDRDMEGSAAGYLVAEIEPDKGIWRMTREWV